MADSETDWEVIIVAKSCVDRENVLDEKWYSAVQGVWLGKVHVENEGGFQAYLQTRTSSEWGWVGLLSGSVAGEVLPIRPDSKDPEGFTRLPAAFNRGSDLNREPQPNLDTIAGNVATLTTRPPRRHSSAVFGGVL